MQNETTTGHEDQEKRIGGVEGRERPEQDAGTDSTRAREIGDVEEGEVSGGHEEERQSRKQGGEGEKSKGTAQGVTKSPLVSCGGQPHPALSLGAADPAPRAQTTATERPNRPSGGRDGVDDRTDERRVTKSHNGVPTSPGEQPATLARPGPVPPTHNAQYSIYHRARGQATPDSSSRQMQSPSSGSSHTTAQFAQHADDSSAHTQYPRAGASHGRSSAVNEASRRTGNSTPIHASGATPPTAPRAMTPAHWSSTSGAGTPDSRAPSAGLPPTGPRAFRGRPYAGHHNARRVERSPGRNSAAARHSGPSHTAKRAHSPDETRDTASKRRREESGTQFVPFEASDRFAASQARINDLELENARQKDEIKDLKMRLAQSSRQVHILRKYGRKQADDIQDNEPWRWQDYLEKCWKKEFGEPRTRDDPGELSDDDEVFGKSSLTAPDFDPATFTGSADDETGETAFPDERDLRLMDIVAINTDKAAAQNSEVGSLDARVAERLREFASGGARVLDHTLALRSLVNDYGEVGSQPLPLPLGTEGHPFLEGWCWGTFKSYRLVRAMCTNQPSKYVHRGTPLFARLAWEASTLDFSQRSMTQREVVSIALDFELKHRLWPTVVEPDVLEMCRTNPTRLPACVRRQMSWEVPDRPGASVRLFEEFDAVDCSIYVRLHGAAPVDGDRQVQSRWRALLERFMLKWILVQNITDEPCVEPFAQGPEPFAYPLTKGCEDSDECLRALWAHLLRCGFRTQSMRERKPLYEFVRRRYDAYIHRIQLDKGWKEKYGDKQPDQKVSRDYTDSYGLWFPLPLDPARPRLRFAVPQHAVVNYQSKKAVLEPKMKQIIDNENALRKEKSDPCIVYGPNKGPWFPFDKTRPVTAAVLPDRYVRYA